MNKRFIRKLICAGEYDKLSKGRWGNADLVCCRLYEKKWVIKDFSPCPPFVRKTWGTWMVRREYRALIRLAGISGIPEEPFMLDRFAVGYRFIPGETLRYIDPADIPADFFYHLEGLVQRMHGRQIVHLDIRNRRNILISDSGKPVLLDFQSSLDLNHVPRFIHRLLKDVDLSGVYKNWIKLRPDSMDEKRYVRFQNINRRRSLWIFKGYPLGTKKARRH